MKNKELLSAINLLKDKLVEDFVSHCLEFDWNCASCRAQVLYGGLDWLEDLYNDSSTSL